MSGNNGTTKQTHSPWSVQVARVSGIPIRIHFTFLLFLAWIALLGRSTSDYTGLALVPAIFFCVLLHELGHALVAQRFGVKTRDITLYPIGGVAMLEGRPKPREEFWIALAGPLVNVAIAILLIPVLLYRDGALPTLTLGLQGKGFLEGLFVANVILPLFNMIPAFPTDGGRVLRAVLAMNMPEVRATGIAGSIGQFFAILLGFYGLFSSSIVLMLVAFFVFIGAGQEVSMSVGLSMIENHRVADAMITRFRTIDSGTTLDQAAQILLQGSQHDFPVTVGENVIGLLTRSDIVRGLASEGASGYVAGEMKRDFPVASPDEPLERVFELMNSENPGPVLVLDSEEKLVGIVTSENLSEFLMIQRARSAVSGLRI